MRRKTLWLLLPALVCGLACSLGLAKDEEVIDPEVAAQDPDFAIQGEYLGEGEVPDVAQGKIGAQVVALSNGEFDVYVLAGGLPGEGWSKGDSRVRWEAKREGDTVTIIKEGQPAGRIADGKMTLTAGDKKIATLERLQRKSRTLGEKPPKSAVVLFDGTSADKFDGGHMTDAKDLLAGCTTKDKFNDYRLHLEFRLSWKPFARGQGRSNSGVYPHDTYEIQVLDSFGLEGRDNECGGLYSIKEPDVNMCFPPLTWQTYDIELTAPKYEGDKKVANAKIKVLHNGVVIHDIELPKGTPGRQPEGPGPRPFHLQGHGNKVVYRNIWLVEK